MTAIDPLMSADMLEATRLTREGRLAEATALMRRLLRSKRERRQHAGGLPGLGRDWHKPALHTSCFPGVRRGSHDRRREERRRRTLRGGGSGIRPAPAVYFTDTREAPRLPRSNRPTGTTETRRPSGSANGAYGRSGTRRRTVRDGHSCGRAWEPRLQAVCPERPSCRSTRAARRHAARMHSVARRFCRRHADEHAGGGADLPGRLSGPAGVRQRPEVLELV